LTDADRCGYPAANVHTLLDEAATGEAIRRELADLAARTGPVSTAVVYFSGHGGQVTGGPHAGDYLLPVDAVYPDDAELARTALPGGELTAALNAIPARKVWVVLDCCHAGGIGRPRQLTAAPVRPGLSDTFYDALRAGRGRVVFASSRADELSWVPAGSEYGLFTRHLLDGLRGGAGGADGFVRVFDLFEYVQPRVTTDQPGQHPVFKAELEDNFAVALGPVPAASRPEPAADGYRYDAYVSFAPVEPDATWVWKTLVPRLRAAGLRVAVSGDVEEGGVDRVVSVERGVEQSRRIVLVLSPAYLADNGGALVESLGQAINFQTGAYRLLPVVIARHPLPLRLSRLVARDLTVPARAEEEFARLLRDLKGPLPHRG
jgi:hypothetical protein